MPNPDVRKELHSPIDSLACQDEKERGLVKSVETLDQKGELDYLVLRLFFLS